MRKKLLWFALFAALFAWFGKDGQAQPLPNPFVYTGVLANIPSGCSVGQVSFITDATPGQNQYNCTATNTWTQNLNSGVGGASTALDNLAAVSINSSLLAQTGVDLGSAAKPVRNIFLFGAGTYGTTSLEFTGTPTGNRVVTVPDATGTLLFNSRNVNTTSPITGGGDLSADRTIACATCATTTNGGALSATAPETISAAGVIACATCATTTNGGSLSGTAPITVSAAGAIACATCTTNAAALTSTAIMTGGGGQASQTPSATATMDSSGNISTPGTLTSGVGSGNAGAVNWINGTAPAIVANSFGFGAPATITTALRLVPPDASPTANQVMLFGAPTANVSNWTWTSISGTGSFCMTTSCTMVTPALGTPASGVATNLTGTATGLTSGISNALKSATTTVDVSAATAPANGQVLTATDSTHATWQTPSAGAGAGNSVTSTTPVTVNTNTTSDQQLMELSLGAGHFNSSKQPFLFDGAGVYTTQTAQTPTLNLKIKLCTVSGCGSGTVVTLISITSTATIAAVTNNNWNLAVLGYTATTGATGNLEIHGPLAVDLGALTTTADSIFVDTNTAVSSNIDLTAALFVDFTIAFSTNAATANTFTQRSGGVMPFAATAAPVTSVFTQTGAVGNLTGDCTTSGSTAVTCTKLNGTAFAGTNGDLVSFGAANIPADSGILATNAVRKDAANTGAAAMTLDMSGATGATALKVPVIAGATAGADGVIDYDSTAKLTKVRTNGADSSVQSVTATSTTTTQVLHATAVAGVGAYSAVATGDIANNAVGAAQMAVVDTRRTCSIIVGADNGNALVNGDLGPQKKLCKVPYAGTVAEIDVSADAGTPNVIVAVRHCSAFTSNLCSTETVTNLLSGALAATTGGFDNCANTGGTTGLDGGTTCTSTLQNTSVAIGDYLELVSGTAGGMAKRMSINVVFTVN